MISVLKVLSFLTAFSSCLSSFSHQTSFSKSRSLPRANPSSQSQTQKDSGTCKNLVQRREWRTLSRAEKASYIKSMKCLTTKPSQLLGKGYRRFDDFQYVHCESRRTVHFSSKFAPFHHYFVLLWENALRNECGYQGGVPYWNWELDAHDFPSAAIFSSDPETGLGTNGKNFTYDPYNLGGGIVSDGAIANWEILYPERQYLERNFLLPNTFALDNNAAMKYVQSQTTYINFINALEGINPTISDELYPGPHGMLHQLLGGDMPKLAYAANDPLFYVLHSNVDRQYDIWVRQNPAVRTMAYNGNKTPGNTRNDASLDDELNLMKLGPNVKVRDTMRWRQPPYCYTCESFCPN
ncbi:hypothetical protein DFH28DRAFT_1077354 [Melampsora americana]|nr:hypothetical protein DFH28DRAFT_1077354 [Melampsora americana]